MPPPIIEPLVDFLFEFCWLLFWSHCQALQACVKALCEGERACVKIMPTNLLATIIVEFLSLILDLLFANRRSGPLD